MRTVCDRIRVLMLWFRSMQLLGSRVRAMWAALRLTTGFLLRLVAMQRVAVLTSPIFCLRVRPQGPVFPKSGRNERRTPTTCLVTWL